MAEFQTFMTTCTLEKELNIIRVEENSKKILPNAH